MVGLPKRKYIKIPSSCFLRRDLQSSPWVKKKTKLGWVGPPWRNGNLQVTSTHGGEPGEARFRKWNYRTWAGADTHTQRKAFVITFVFTFVSCINIYLYIYIYNHKHIHIHVYIYIHICMYMYLKSCGVCDHYPNTVFKTYIYTPIVCVRNLCNSSSMWMPPPYNKVVCTYTSIRKLRFMHTYIYMSIHVCVNAYVQIWKWVWICL